MVTTLRQRRKKSRFQIYRKKAVASRIKAVLGVRRRAPVVRKRMALRNRFKRKQRVYQRYRSRQEWFRKKRGLGSRPLKKVPRGSRNGRGRAAYAKSYDGEVRIRTHGASGTITPCSYVFPGTYTPAIMAVPNWPVAGVGNNVLRESITFFPSYVVSPEQASTDDSIMGDRYRVNKGKHIVRVQYPGAGVSDDGVGITQRQLSDRHIYVRCMVVCSGRNPTTFMTTGNDGPSTSIATIGATSVGISPVGYMARVLSNFTDCTSPLIRDRDAVTDEAGLYIVYDRILDCSQRNNYIATCEFETYPGYDSGWSMDNVRSVSDVNLFNSEGPDRYYYLFLNAVGQPDDFLSGNQATVLERESQLNVTVQSSFYLCMISGPSSSVGTNYLTLDRTVWPTMSDERTPKMMVTMR